MPAGIVLCNLILCYLCVSWSTWYPARVPQKVRHLTFAPESVRWLVRLSARFARDWEAGPFDWLADPHGSAGVGKAGLPQSQRNLRSWHERTYLYYENEMWIMWNVISDIIGWMIEARTCEYIYCETVGTVINVCRNTWLKVHLLGNNSLLRFVVV